MWSSNYHLKKLQRFDCEVFAVRVYTTIRSLKENLEEIKEKSQNNLETF